MSTDTINDAAGGAAHETINEARRQIEICNACRYCEGYCSVFPAIHRQRSFSLGDVIQFANLCHNCRNCYYACQYTEPHEFALNLPAALAQVRRESWQDFAVPRGFAAAFQKSGTAIAIAAMCGFAALFLAAKALKPDSGAGFYAVLSQGTMVAIFLPAFVLPLISIAISLGRYRRATGGGRIRPGDLVSVFGSAARMDNLAGGHGDGCNFEDEDRFTHGRRHVHHAVTAGFLLCFAATCSGTVMHYFLDMPAPYSILSVPKLLGLPGGLLLSIGTLAMIGLKLKADGRLSDAPAFGGEMGFIVLLFFVSTSGLVLYALGSTALMPSLLALHLGSVLAFFLLMPFSKMAHGFYRLAALAGEAARQREARESGAVREPPDAVAAGNRS